MGHPAMVWRRKSLCGRRSATQSSTLAACGYVVQHCRLSSSKGDDLAEQAQALSNRTYEEAAQRLPGTMRQMEVTVPGGAPITGFLHMPKGDGRFDSINVWWSGCDADGLVQPV
ncbi:alpha/beta hydrolase [Escherichia coli]